MFWFTYVTRSWKSSILPLKQSKNSKTTKKFQKKITGGNFPPSGFFYWKDPYPLVQASKNIKNQQKTSNITHVWIYSCHSQLKIIYITVKTVLKLENNQNNLKKLRGEISPHGGFFETFKKSYPGGVQNRPPGA